MNREALIAQAEGFAGIAVAIMCSVGVVHGFEHAMKPTVLLCTAAIAVVALCINALTTEKPSGAIIANPAASISPKRAVLMAGGLLLFGFAIWALGLV
ncbi:hypothetical protein [Devosia sp. FKR38]|uniref:hypothetical protein n=1 Tax=Devosia sp. FKR38 TaxID=2562312 RepID=UPI0010C0D606|nr:hypothetical protein [Devosia sp. FKR38]